MIARIINAWRSRAAARYWLAEARTLDVTARDKNIAAKRAASAAEKVRLYCEGFAASERAEACRARSGGDWADAIAREKDAQWWDAQAAQRQVAQIIDLAEVRRNASA